MKCFTITLLAAALSTASALELTFRRFSRPGCHEDRGQHISDDTHLEDGKCKSFDMDEPVFYSFQVIPDEDHRDDLEDKYCYAVVYDGEDCQGNAFTHGDMNDYAHQCANTSTPGRSVRIQCDNSGPTQTRSMKSTPSPTPTPSPTKKERLPTTTVTLVPAEGHEDDDCCNDNDWRA